MRPSKDQQSQALVKFAFDAVFGPVATTEEVYNTVARDLVSSAMGGVHSTVFAYGQTSSGKTYTMRGKRGQPGVIPMAVHQLFSIIENTPDRDFLLRVSYIEIYNEVINDLLAPASTNLRLREDKEKGVYVENVKEEVVVSIDHIMGLIVTGETHRHVGSTNYNSESSRSHTIFQLCIESNSRAHPHEGVQLSKMNLIDLAGSESSKVDYEMATAGVRRREGAYINKSLLTLGTVITKLSDGHSSHVPYRDSKLTRYLQSSLSGHSRISVVCTVTPASRQSDETHNTLKFAQRAKFVEVCAVTTHVQDDKALIRQYQREILELRKQLQEVAHGNARVEGTPTNTSYSGSSPTTWEQDKAQLELRIQRLKRIILHSSNRPEAHPQESRRRHASASLPTGSCSSHPLEDDLNQSPPSTGLGVGSADDGATASPTEEHLKERTNVLFPFRRWFGTPKAHPTPETRPCPLFGAETPGNANWASTPPHSSKHSNNSTPGSHLHSKSPLPRTSGEMPCMAGELFTGSLEGANSTRKESDDDTAALLQEEMRALVKEAMEKDQELQKMSYDLQLSQERHTGTIGQLQAQLLEKTRQMSHLENRMVALAHAGVNSHELLTMINKMRREGGDRYFQLQVALADNNLLKEAVEELQRENKLLSSQLSDAALASQDGAYMSISRAVHGYTKALDVLLVAQAEQSLDLDQISDLEELHLKALFRLRTEKESCHSH